MASTFKTEDGREVRVGIRHGSMYLPGKKGHVRYTDIWLHSATRDGQPISIEARAICSTKDRFCRATGRKIARADFMEKYSAPQRTAVRATPKKVHVWFIADEFSKSDRRRIFQMIFPEFQKRHVKPRPPDTSVALCAVRLKPEHGKRKTRSGA